MKTYNIEKIKGDIKSLSSDQKFLKDQRKSIHNKLDRKLDPWDATVSHLNNREKLRMLYAAYGLMRGKSFSVTENKYTEENHPLNNYKSYIDKLIKEYELELQENQLV